MPHITRYKIKNSQRLMFAVSKSGCLFYTLLLV